MNLRPVPTWPDALDATPRARALEHLLWRDPDAVSKLLHRPLCANNRRNRKVLAIDYLWNGDVDKAVSLACDMLCFPAPAGFRSLLLSLLQIGRLKAWEVDAGVNRTDTSRVPVAPSPLSAKETAVLRLISTGHCNKSIARELHIAPETVKCHAKKIFFKLSTRTRAEAVARAAALGIL